MGMTAAQLQEWLKTAGQFGPLAAAVGNAGQSSADRAQQAAELAYRKQQDQFNNQLALYNAQKGSQDDAYTKTANARAAQAAFQQSLLNGQTDRGVSLANASPLGAEQNFVARMGMLGNSSKQLQQQAPPSYGGVVNPFSGMDLTPFGNDATVASLANRRKILAAIYPEMEMGSMGSYGLSNTAGADADVAKFAAGVLDQRSGNEQLIKALLDAQMAEAQSTANQPQLPTLNAAGMQVAAPEEKKSGGGFWKKLGRGLLKIAPIAAMAIPGLGPVASTLLQAGLGAANGAASGGGLKGALLGGAVGAVGGKMGGVSQAGAGTNLMSNLKTAIINPQSLIKVGSSFAPTPIQQAIDMGANTFLKAPQFAKISNPTNALPSGQDAYIQSQLQAGRANPIQLPSTRSIPNYPAPNVTAQDPLAGVMRKAVTTIPRSGGPVKSAVTNHPPLGGWQPPGYTQSTPNGIPPEIMQYLLQVLGQR